MPDPYYIQASTYVQKMSMYNLRCAAEENCLARYHLGSPSPAPRLGSGGAAQVPGSDHSSVQTRFGTWDARWEVERYLLSMLTWMES